MGSTQELGSLERLMRREGTCEQFNEQQTLKAFLYNLVATAPLELLGARTGMASLSLFKTNRLARLYDAPRCIRLVFALLEHHAKMEIGPLRMWLFFLIMAVAAHWAACCFFLASRAVTLGVAAALALGLGAVAGPRGPALHRVDPGAGRP